MPGTEKTYPDWVQEFRTRGTTVKKKGDAYYLYKRTSKRVPGKKYPQSVDTYIGLITPDGVIPSGKKKLDISSAEVREFGYSKALKDLCPETWKKPLGDEWMDVLLHIISTWSCKSYLLRDKPLKDEKELHCSLNSQYGLLSRKFYKKYGVDIETLRELEDIYIIYMDGHEIISRISEKQETIIKLFNLKLEVD